MHMCRVSHSSESHMVLLSIFLLSQPFWLACQYNNFKFSRTSFNFSLIDDFLSMSIKVGQTLSRRRRLQVAETSPQSCVDVAVKSRRRRHNLFSISLVYSRSRTRRGDVSLVENKFSRCNVAAKSRRPTGDLKKSPKNLRNNLTCSPGAKKLTLKKVEK